MAPKGPPGSIVRKSWSRPDSAGGRKEIPLTASLESLTPSSKELPKSSDESITVPARSRTPVGAAAPRRSVSAHRKLNNQAYQQQHGGLPDDDSLVLYKDPSEISEQQSQVSVVSGRHQAGETFFTALRRNYSYESSEPDYDSQAEGQSAAEGLSCINSQLNPIQSPNSSVYFTAAGGGSEYVSAADGLQEEYSEAASMATCESSYVTAADTSQAAVAQGGLLPTASVVEVINSLYCLQATGPPGQLQQQRVPKWHELDEEGQPLIQPSSVVAGAAAPDPQQQLPLERSAVSSVGSCDTATADGAGAAAADAVDEQDRGQTPGHLLHELQPEEHLGVLHRQASGQQLPSAESTCVAIGGSCSAAQEELRDIFYSASQADILIEASSQEADSTQQQEPATKEPLIQATAATVLKDGDNETQEQEDATVYLTEVEGLLSKRAEVHAALGVYMQQLTSKADAEGQQLVDMPADYNLMVERLLRERRSQYQALQGWEGPHRFDDLPVAQLPVSHDDPGVSAGLEVIRQLDVQLKEVWLKALIAARDAAPEEWAESERQRLARRAAQLDEGLAKERQKRLHAARLLRALNKLDEEGGLADDRGLSSYTYYQLKPEEEQVLAAVLKRSDAALEQENPFDPSSAVLDSSSLEELEALTAQLVQQSSRCLSAVASNLDKSMSLLLTDYAAAGSVNPAGPEAAEPSAADVDGQKVEAEGGINSCQPSAENSVISAMSNRPRHTLAEIDALLLSLQPGKQEQLQGGIQQAGHLRPSVLDSRSSSRSIAASDRRTSHSCQPYAGKQVGRLLSPGNRGPAAGQEVDIQQQPTQQDHIREQREARELRDREREIDAKLRALRTSELSKPSAAELQALILECKQACSTNGVESQPAELGPVAG